jgi:hypothetical protein
VNNRPIKSQIIKYLGLTEGGFDSDISSNEKTGEQESQDFLDRMSDIGVPVEPRLIKKIGLYPTNPRENVDAY